MLGSRLLDEAEDSVDEDDHGDHGALDALAEGERDECRDDQQADEGIHELPRGDAEVRRTVSLLEPVRSELRQSRLRFRLRQPMLTVTRQRFLDDLDRARVRVVHVSGQSTILGRDAHSVDGAARPLTMRTASAV